ncbi:P-loop containing nucleoside triphosphate hydrolase protein [Boletus coccyginus]|nr:P-loop containing nucleoside triphosphate hydrolase protein [Boletus coccyginus]
MEKKLNRFKNPPRPVQPVIPDGEWEFIKRCWSPRLPRIRPSAQEILSFCRDKPELSQSSPAPAINVVLFGALGCGKSSIINLLAGKPLAQVSADADPCTQRPQLYQISIGGRQFQMWDTMGFDTNTLLPYEQAYTVLRSLADGVSLILLCARKDKTFPSLGSAYQLINDFFYGGRAPIALVMTHFDTPDEGWWERNHGAITQKTNIPVQSIPNVCITTVQTSSDQSRQALKALLENYATTSAPSLLRLNPSSVTTASLVSASCGLSYWDAEVLAKILEKPRPANVVFFGNTGSGKSSLINLIAGHTIAEVSSGGVCTLDSRPYKIRIGARWLQIWDTMGFKSSHDTRATESATQLIRSLPGEGGIDLIVFIMRGSLTPSELSCYRLFEEVLCGGQVPVALVVTHLESYNPMEEWWETNGNDLLKHLRGNVIGHACITSHMSGVQEDPGLSDKLKESRLSVRVLLEDCVSSLAK